LTLQNVQNIFGSKSYAEWEILHAWQDLWSGDSGSNLVFR
jgi:hypothetical protein